MENHLTIAIVECNETNLFRKILLHTKAKTKTKTEKGPKCALFSKCRRFEDISGISKINKISKISKISKIRKISIISRIRLKGLKGMKGMTIIEKQFHQVVMVGKIFDGDLNI